MLLSQLTILERAFELARSGDIDSLEHLRLKLHAEGYLDSRSQIAGPTLQRQLRDLMRAARGMESLSVASRKALHPTQTANNGGTDAE
jgi:hypothetical protein